MPAEFDGVGPMDMDPREIAAAVGRLTGQEAIADEVLSGDVSARDTIPLLAGMTMGMLRDVFCPVSQCEVQDMGSNPLSGNTFITIRTKRGERIILSMEAVAND